MNFFSNSMEFEYYALVKEIIEKENRKYIIKDPSHFYAEAGGQVSDKGTIGDCKVLSVKSAGNLVFHEVDAPCNLKSGDRVKCIVDRDYRLEVSRQHTGQHLMSAILENDYGIKTVSFHMTDEISTIDTDLPVTPEIREEVLVKVMDRIRDNLKVDVFVTKKQDIDRFGLRKFVEAEGDIQIVKIGDIDYSACCGTHMENTGDLKMFLIKKVENYKGGSRVHFLFGNRAQENLYESASIVDDLKNLLQVHESEISFRVRLMMEKEGDEHKEVMEIREKLVKYMTASPEYNVPFIYKELDEEEELIKALFSALGKEKKTAVLIDKRELRMYAAASKEGFHLGNFFKSVNTGKIRGGGGPTSLQAVFGTEEEMTLFAGRFTDRLYEEINK